MEREMYTITDDQDFPVKPVGDGEISVIKRVDLNECSIIEHLYQAKTLLADTNHWIRYGKLFNVKVSYEVKLPLKVRKLNVKLEITK